MTMTTIPAHLLHSSEIVRWADSSETSIEICAALIALFGERAESVWDDPTAKEESAVLALAEKHTDEDVLFWGLTQFRVTS